MGICILNMHMQQVLLKGLTPITDYSIQVAAVNNQSDMGVFNEPIYLQTCEKRQFFHMICISLHSRYVAYAYSIAWAMGNGCVLVNNNVHMGF